MPRNMIGFISFNAFWIIQGLSHRISCLVPFNLIVITHSHYISTRAATRILSPISLYTAKGDLMPPPPQGTYLSDYISNY
jgi:hypothetical protein